MSQKWPCEPHEQHQPAELEGRAKWLQGRPLQAQNRACSKHRACRSLMKTPNRLDAPFLFQAAWSRDFFNLGCLRAVQLGHGDQLSGRLADGGHLRKGAPHLRSRVGRRHTAAAQALQADPACLGRCLSWTCARRSTQGHRLVHHGYRRRSRTSSFSTQTPHTANQCRYGLQVLCYASVWSGPCLLACRGMLRARRPLGRPPAGRGGVF